MGKRTGRKADLRRLAAKRGWQDGREGNQGSPPVKAVWHPNGARLNPVPQDEEQAYWDGYEEGRAANAGANNPYVIGQ